MDNDADDDGAAEANRDDGDYADVAASQPLLLQRFEVCCGNWNCRAQHDWVLTLQLRKATAEQPANALLQAGVQLLDIAELLERKLLQRKAETLLWCSCYLCTAAAA